jgi:predicted esterase
MIPHPPRRPVALLLLVALVLPVAARADVVTLESGLVLKGDVDKDGTILAVFDGLRRVLVRDTKVASRQGAAADTFESFKIDQPLVTHSGAMPTYAVGIDAGPWDDTGRRAFSYIGPGSSKPVRMTQALIELGPKAVRFRGIDGFWRGQVATSQVPKSVILALLAKTDPADQNTRLKLGRFLIQAEWYPEALAELDRIAKDFPDLAETVKTVRRSVASLRAQQALDEAALRRKAGQPREVARLLKALPAPEVPPELVEQARGALRELAAQADADRQLAARVREAGEALAEPDRKGLRPVTLAMLRDLDEAPDALRDRFAAFAKGTGDAPAARYARALSGWLAGPEGVTDSLDDARALLSARDAIAAYLSSSDPTARATALDSLRLLQKERGAVVEMEALARLVKFLPPPLRSPGDEAPGRARLLRARDDENAEPTEYVAILPPEYTPLRSYPAVVVLHAGDGPEAAARAWAAEAARRGFVVIAPQYNLAGQPRDYRYTASEHAAVEIALRDARKRFAIDPDRAFLAGTLLGANMAWDFGLAHPDLFAGTVVLSGLPAKYVFAYRDHGKFQPLYMVLGDLAPAETDLVAPFGTSFVARNYDALYVEHFRRGLEAFPEEIPEAFAWMANRRRDPYPKEFEFNTARDCDARFFGVVVQEFAPGRTVPPEQADNLGKNLKPATLTVRYRTLANLLDIETTGLAKIDAWLAPPHLDLGKRLEIRINGRTAFKGVPTVDPAPFLEDLRLRGDRSQVYFLRYAAALGGARPR